MKEQREFQYFDKLIEAMDYLASKPETLFLGQSVKWDGHALFKTLKNVPEEKRLELPVAEDFQMGLSTGLALQGIVPVSIFPRWDFLILATNQMVNHLDKIPQLSHGLLRPKVIIRTSVGGVHPLNPGPQHCQDHTAAFRLMFHSIEVFDLKEPDEILPAYKKAYGRDDGASTLIVEHMDFYNEK